ncbi:MAG TPA: ATP synthase F1 subunit epsilon [Abditibacteriaceae bacterium]|nr:ATP synthase F1 subunit epsilon [Abditibacteriaceae bacterium]
MAGIFSLQVVTPEREVFNGEVESITLPGMESRFGVLRSHAPMIAALTAGYVEITDANGQVIRMAVGGGFFQVADNVAMILADSAETASDINVERAREAENRAQSRLNGQMDGGFQLERTRAEAALKRAQNRLRIAGNR